MANPVLLGTAIQNLNPPNVFVRLNQKTVTASNGQVIPIQSLFEIDVSFESSAAKPLWILDGQHRIRGLSVSKQKGELIPFVLLHDTSKYTPPFLAEIFTHVTTGAKPMEPIHGEWMKYAFKLDRYGNVAHKSAMETAIFLCKEATLSDKANPFHNQIQFNPYLNKPKWNAFEFDAIEWEKIVSGNYYGKGGKLSPRELAEEIVKSTLAFENLDTHKGTDSKLFSTKPHKILAEAYLIGLLSYLAVNKQNSFEDWQSFYLDQRRAVNRCNFSLPFIKTVGALSSNNGKPSKQIATQCFTDFFLSPSKLNGQILTDYLQGIGGEVIITSYESKSGRIDRKTKFEKSIPFGSGLTPYDLSTGGIKRNIVTVKSGSSNVYINSVKDGNFKPAKDLKQMTTYAGQNVDTFPGPDYKIEIEYMSYGGDTRRVTEIRLDK